MLSKGECNIFTTVFRFPVHSGRNWGSIGIFRAQYKQQWMFYRKLELGGGRWVQEILHQVFFWEGGDWNGQVKLRKELQSLVWNN